MTESSHRNLMNAVAVLTDWRLVRTFECNVVETEPAEQGRRTFRLHAEPMRSSYSFVDQDSGLEQSYDDATRSIRVGPVVKTAEVNDLLFVPTPARLAFPMSLPIWGRRNDAFRMEDADRRDDLLKVQLPGRADPALAGTLTLDLNWNLAIAFDTPTLQVEYRGIEIARSRFDGAAR